MDFRLARRRTIWWPTLFTWTWLLILIGSVIAWWCFRAESFLSLTERHPAEVLIVEGWIGYEGIHAAKAEYDRGGYKYVITAGGPMNNRWAVEKWNYATESHDLLLKLGIPADRIIEAPASNSENHRTFESARTVREVLQKRNLQFTNFNVFSFGAHARRSQLVFTKALHLQTKVGVIAWVPAHFTDGAWWDSSERALDLIKETIGYFFEFFLNSGRFSNGGDHPPPPNR